MSDGDPARQEIAIQRLLFDYAWACDNGDWKLLPTLFTTAGWSSETWTDGRSTVCSRTTVG